MLFDFKEESKVIAVEKNIKHAMLHHKEVKNKDYWLECSFSAALFTSEFTSLNAFLSKLDFLMYKEKFSKVNKNINVK